MRKVGLVLGLTFAFLAGCRSDDTSNADGGNGPDGGGGDDIDIADIQTPGGPSSTVGTAVTLRGVVVTAVDRFGNRTGGVYVQEPAGGPYSGIYVYNPMVAGGTIDDIAEGDVVDIEGGVVDEFALDTDTSGRTLTEISPPMGGMITLTETGTGQVPAPEVLDPRTLVCEDTDMSGCDEAEKWEGVLITIEDVAVVDPASGVSSTDATLAEMVVTGPFRVSSSLTALLTPAPDNQPLYARGECFASVTGIGDYFFNYKMLPRSSADLVAGGTCAAEVCGNMIDDDANGFTDCADFACQATDPACTVDATIEDVQMGTIAAGTRVRLPGVVVTGKATSLLWVQTPGGTTYSGVVVYNGAGFDVTLLPGDVVTVEGTISEYATTTPAGDATTTEITAPTVTETGTGPALAALVVADPATLVDPATAEPYEGVLVRVENVRAVAAPDMFGEWTVGTAAAPLHVDDMMFDQTPVPAPGDCYSIVQGPFHYGFGNYKIEPRNAADVVIGAACP